MGFFYEAGRLKVGTPDMSLDVEELARSSSGPAYIYDLDDIALRASALEKAMKPLRHSPHFAMKSNSHPEILKLFAAQGFGVDTVSGGEIKIALAAGVKPEKIVFSGVAKTKDEISFALKNVIKQINVESPQELVRVAETAEKLGTIADVAFRMNPDVNPQTHPYITTGFRENKFGMDVGFIPELLRILSEWPHRLRLRGLTMHIGSLLFDLGVIREAIEKTLRVHRELETKGHRLDRLDIGGGLGIRYETAETTEEFALMESYGRMANDALKDMKVEVLTEPGRILVGRSGILVGEVQYIKSTGEKTFAILDTGMHHLIRPALYGAKHRITKVLAKHGPTKTYDVVGPICESSDFLGKNVAIEELAQGDLVAVMDAGAYGFAMASRYNSHDLPKQIAVRDGRVITAESAGTKH